MAKEIVLESYLENSIKNEVQQKFDKQDVDKVMQEIRENPRSRSAKMRVIEKTN